MTRPGAKTNRYRRILEQVRALAAETSDPMARMATVAALLHHKMTGFSWTGFYVLREGDLLVGPYQGPLACLVLKREQGVCWAGVLRDEPVIVPDVHAFPGHIPCDGRTRSEIVVPVRRPGDGVAAVLDVDSTRPAWFDEEDARGLQPLADLVYADDVSRHLGPD